MDTLSWGHLKYSKYLHSFFHNLNQSQPDAQASLNMHHRNQNNFFSGTEYWSIYGIMKVNEGLLRLGKVPISPKTGSIMFRWRR